MSGHSLDKQECLDRQDKMLDNKHSRLVRRQGKMTKELQNKLGSIYNNNKMKFGSVNSNRRALANKISNKPPYSLKGDRDNC